MSDKLEMPLEQFAEAVAKENVRLNENNEKLKEQTKLYFHAFNKASNHIEKLEVALRSVLQYRLTDETWVKLGFDPKKIRVEFDAARKALEGNLEKSVYKEGYRAVEEAMGHPSPEFWVEKK